MFSWRRQHHTWVRLTLALLFLVLTNTGCSLQRAANLVYAEQQSPAPIQCDCPPLSLEQALLQTPDWHDDFSLGWNARHGRGDLNNRNANAPSWRFAQMQTAAAGQVIAGPADNTNNVMQFLWQQGAGKNEDKNTQKKAHLYGEFGRNAEQRELWSVDLYLPSADMRKDAEPEIILQWHGVADRCETDRNPPISIENRNDRLSISWRFDERACTPFGFDRWLTGWQDLGETPKDRWFNLRLAVHWQPLGGGRLEVWIDGKKQVEKLNIPIGYNDAKGAYFGFGLYKYTLESEHPRRRLLVDNVSYWNLLPEQ